MWIDDKKTAELLLNADNILILTHRNPDGDTLGCAVALCRALHSLGKRARIINDGVIPKKFDYLSEGLDCETFEPEFIVAVDVADKKLLGEKTEKEYGDRVDLCIDHHGTNGDYARNTFLSASDGAAAMALYRLLTKMNVEITPAIASALYTGISTDTGCFCFSNTTSETLRICADLIDAGANNAAINTAMFDTKPVAYFELLSASLAGKQVFFDGKVILLTVTNEMFQRTGATPDLVESIASTAIQFEGAVCGITMREKQEGGFKLSLRTREPLDASKLCAAFGGGGHKRAAGCELATGREEKQLSELLALIEKELKDLT